MAEAWTNKLKGDRFEACSAGVKAKEIDPREVKAMAESGIDISGQGSKDIHSLGNLEFDYVVTLCDNAKESCPFFPARTRLIHRSFEDPPKLTAHITDEEEAMTCYRRVRDEIRDFIENLPEALREEKQEEPRTYDY
jgi:arsenate reductase